MTPLEQTLIVTLCLLLAVWIVMLGAVLIIAWRLRKTIMAVVLAVRGLKALAAQVRGLADVLKRDIRDTTRHTRQGWTR